MSNKKGVVSIASNHIEAGIKKYKGESNARLNALIKNAGRILLVLPDNTGALLYADNDTLFEILDLTR